MKVSAYYLTPESRAFLAAEAIRIRAELGYLRSERTRRVLVDLLIVRGGA